MACFESRAGYGSPPFRSQPPIMSHYPERPIAILFSGGDSPGMNALLRAVARLGLNRHGVPVLGVRDGYRGLVRAAKRAADEKEIFCMKQEIASRRGRWGLIHAEQDIVWLDHAAVSGVVRLGGIALGSARCPEFKKSTEVRQDVVRLLRALDLRALVVCGGDGSLAGAEWLAANSGIRVIGIPCTIDNDLEFTEMSIGVDTAVTTLVWAVDHFKDTARAHRRVMVLETMGAKHGELARLAAVASGAEMVITPEEGVLTQERIRKLAESIEEGMKHGRGHAIILVAEGVEIEGDPPPPAKKRNRAYVINDIFQAYFQREGAPFSELEVRPSVLGHLQRGGHPTPADCILAARFADQAWNSVMAKDENSGITALRLGRVELVPFGSGPMPERQEFSAEFTRLHQSLSMW